jgi:hypothetical protein
VAILDPVNPGQMMRPPAAAWNLLMQMLQWWLNSASGDRGRMPVIPLSGFVDVRNESGSDVPRFGVLKISALVFNPSAALPAFQAGPPTVKGIAPDGPSPAGGIVILQNGLAAGAPNLIRAIASGISPVRLSVTDEGHRYADTAEDDVETLHSASSGPALILAKESGTGTKWGYVILPAGSGAAMAYAKVTAVYNAAGDTWTDFPTDGFPYSYEVNPCDSAGGNTVTGTTLTILACPAPTTAVSSTILEVGDVLAWMPGDGAITVPGSDPAVAFDGMILPGFGGLAPIWPRVVPGP